MAQLNSLSIGGSPVADFIVERGTSSVAATGDQYTSSGRITITGGTAKWYWAKYNSGVVECWGELTISDTTTEGQYNAIKAALPSNLFKTRLMAICSMSDWTIDSTYDNSRDNPLTEFQLVYWARKSNTTDRKFTVHMYGTWK